MRPDDLRKVSITQFGGVLVTGTTFAENSTIPLLALLQARCSSFETLPKHPPAPTTTRGARRRAEPIRSIQSDEIKTKHPAESIQRLKLTADP